MSNENPQGLHKSNRVSGRKWPCLGQLVSGFFYGFFFTNVLKYMWNAVFYEWQHFLDFEEKKLFLRCQWLFPFGFATSHINVDWFKTMCVSLSASWSYIRITNVKGRALKILIYSKTISLKNIIPSLLSFIVAIWVLVRSL